MAFIYSVVLVMLLAGGCGKSPVTEDLPPVVTNPPPVSVGVTFEMVKAGVLKGYCLQCHTGGSRDLSTYQGAMQYVVAGKPERSKLCEVVRDGSMPLGSKLPAAKIKDLCDWISDGAKES